MEEVRLDDTLNKQWKNDKSGFGFRMLQKMGWSEEKGLGKNETGMVSHLKVKTREQGLGLGVEGIDVAGNKGWAETTSSFNAVLDILKSSYKGNERERKNKKEKKGKKEKKNKKEKVEGEKSEGDNGKKVSKSPVNGIPMISVGMK